MRSTRRGTNQPVMRVKAKRCDLRTLSIPGRKERPRDAPGVAVCSELKLNETGAPRVGTPLVAYAAYDCPRRVVQPYLRDE